VLLFCAGLIGTAKAASRSPDELAQIAHDAMQNNGFYAPLKRELFAEDFVFRGPVVGPLCMADYAGTLEVFKVYKAFPDVKIDQSEWTQDPHDPLRYWGIMRVSGTHTGDLNLHDTVVKPTGKRMVVGPQANSITFDEHGKVKYLTSGYVTDYHDTEGQTGEYGLVFAILKSIGIPIPGMFSLAAVHCAAYAVFRNSTRSFLLCSAPPVATACMLAAYNSLACNSYNSFWIWA
jgi:hypothetical protein